MRKISLHREILVILNWKLCWLINTDEICHHSRQQFLPWGRFGWHPNICFSFDWQEACWECIRLVHYMDSCVSYIQCLRLRKVEGTCWNVFCNSQWQLYQLYVFAFVCHALLSIQLLSWQAVLHLCPRWSNEGGKPIGLCKPLFLMSFCPWIQGLMLCVLRVYHAYSLLDLLCVI